MLVNLLKYEFMKTWNGMKYILLGYSIIQIILLTISRILLADSNKVPFFSDGSVKSEDVNGVMAIFITLYFLSSIIIIFIPFITGLTRYEKDLSGKQASLELMIPSPSWKKIMSKLIVILSASIVALIIVFISSVIFALVMSNFNGSVMNAIINGINELVQYPFSSIFILAEGILSFLSFGILVFFCTVIAKAITHKSKISTLISIITFGVLLFVRIYLLIQVYKYPIHTFILPIENRIYSVSDIILSIVTLILMFIGTSYIMEKRIEL